MKRVVTGKIVVEVRSERECVFADSDLLHEHARAIEREVRAAVEKLHRLIPDAKVSVYVPSYGIDPIAD